MSLERVFSIESHRCGRRRVEFRGGLRLGPVSRIHVSEHTCCGTDRGGCFTQAPAAKTSDQNHQCECQSDGGNKNGVGHLYPLIIDVFLVHHARCALAMNPGSTVQALSDKQLECTRGDRINAVRVRPTRRAVILGRSSPCSDLAFDVLTYPRSLCFGADCPR